MTSEWRRDLQLSVKNQDARESSSTSTVHSLEDRTHWSSSKDADWEGQSSFHIVFFCENIENKEKCIKKCFPKILAREVFNFFKNTIYVKEHLLINKYTILSRCLDIWPSLGISNIKEGHWRYSRGRIPEPYNTSRRVGRPQPSPSRLWLRILFEGHLLPRPGAWKTCYCCRYSRDITDFSFAIGKH